MKLILRLAALACLAFLALTLAAPSHAKPAAAPADTESLAYRVVDLTNQQRIAAGLSPLQWNNALAEAGKDYAQEMAARGFFAHNSPDGTTPVSRGAEAGYPPFEWGEYIGENLAMGFNSADTVMQGWMNSEGHRRNLLLPDYREIGVGIAVAQDGTMYWAQEFGNRPAYYSEQ